MRSLPIQHKDRGSRVIKKADQAGQLKGRGDQMRTLIARVKRISRGDIPALIQGETGTGKELCAQAIHRLSVRKSRTLVTVNCGAIPTALLTAELFGSERNAYTDASDRRGLIASAHLGTLFLDEVGELSLEAQAALLRVLETGELRRLGSDKVRQIDIRLICATHRDLGEMVQNGQFRSDLFHRIAVGVLKIPPLRERSDDLPYLVAEISESVASRLTDSAWSLIHEYMWPGNIRELKNVINCAELEYPSGELSAQHLQIPTTGPWRSCQIRPKMDIQRGSRALISPQLSSARADNDDQEFRVLSKEEISELEGTTLFRPDNEKFLVTGSPKHLRPLTPPGGGLPPAESIALSEPFEEVDQKIESLIVELPTMSLEELKKTYVQCQYLKFGENLSETSRLLKLSRGTVYRLLGRSISAA